jgi:ABC-type sugar transport system ATPase subunit
MLGDRIALMNKGRIVETGTAQKLFLSPEHEFTARFFGFGQTLSCVIKGETSGAFLADTPLGLLSVRGKPRQTQNGKALLFVPRDGVTLAGGGEEPKNRDRKKSGEGTAVFKHAVFEGDRMILITGLEGGAEFPVDASLRTSLPRPGDRLKLRIDESTLKFLKPED